MEYRSVAANAKLLFTSYKGVEWRKKPLDHCNEEPWEWIGVDGMGKAHAPDPTSARTDHPLIVWATRRALWGCSIMHLFDRLEQGREKNVVCSKSSQSLT